MATGQLIRLVGIVFAAVSFVVLGDTAGKMLAMEGVHPFVIAWARFALAAVVFFPFSGVTREEIEHFLDWRVLLRAGLITAGISSILTALKTEPIANVFGAFFIGPMVLYILAIVFLREKPSLFRGLSLGLGFVGVLLVVKPGFGMNAGIGFALLAGVFYGSYLAVTKLISGKYRPRFLLFSQLAIGSVLLAPIGLSQELPQLDFALGVLFLLSAAGSAIGNYLLVIANRRGEAGLIAPLVYLQLISATIFGVLVFGDWPDSLSMIGLGIIVFSGLAALFGAKNTAQQNTAQQNTEIDGRD